MLTLTGALLRSLLIALGVALSCGVGAVEGLSPEQAAQLEARVEARWAALEEGDSARAYTFLSPAYRAVFTQEMYAAQFAAARERELTSVEILNYDAAAAVASVAVGVMSRPVKLTSAASAAIQTLPVKVVEQWILRNNQWWFSVIK